MVVMHSLMYSFLTKISFGLMTAFASGSPEDCLMKDSIKELLLRK